jgi:hypothetical protein
MLNDEFLGLANFLESWTLAFDTTKKDGELLEDSFIVHWETRLL